MRFIHDGFSYLLKFVAVSLCLSEILVYWKQFENDAMKKLSMSYTWYCVHSQSTKRARGEQKQLLKNFKRLHKSLIRPLSGYYKAFLRPGLSTPGPRRSYTLTNLTKDWNGEITTLKGLGEARALFEHEGLTDHIPTSQGWSSKASWSLHKAKEQARSARRLDGTFKTQVKHHPMIEHCTALHCTDRWYV